MGRVPQSYQERQGRTFTVNRGRGGQALSLQVTPDIGHDPADQVVGIDTALPQGFVEFVSIPICFAAQSADVVQQV
jgi:hypothetical protein